MTSEMLTLNILPVRHFPSADMLGYGDMRSGKVARRQRNDYGDPGCQAGHQVSCVMIRKKIEKDCRLESGTWTGGGGRAGAHTSGKHQFVN